MNIHIQKIEESRIGSVDINTVPFGSVFADHMFLADYEEGAWKNPRIVPYGPLSMSPSAMALHYGQTIFEGMKAFKNTDGSVFISRIPDHNTRFNISAERMCMPTIPLEIFEAGLTELIALDEKWIPTGEQSSLYVRPCMYATEEHVGVRPSKKYTFAIFTCPANVYYSKPLNVKVEKTYTRAVPGGTGFAKTGGNYAGSLLPTEKAKAEGFDQVIWTDGATHSKIEESGTMNLMFVIDGKILTPALSDTILKGITRDTILMIARRKGIEVIERDIFVSEIEEAIKSKKLTEAFGTGTAVVVVPIQSISIDGQKYEIEPGNTTSIVEEKSPSKSVASSIAEELVKIRKGELPDEFGWMKKIV